MQDIPNPYPGPDQTPDPTRGPNPGPDILPGTDPGPGPGPDNVPGDNPIPGQDPVIPPVRDPQMPPSYSDNPLGNEPVFDHDDPDLPLRIPLS